MLSCWQKQLLACAHRTCGSGVCTGQMAHLCSTSLGWEDWKARVTQRPGLESCAGSSLWGSAPGGSVTGGARRTTRQAGTRFLTSEITPCHPHPDPARHRKGHRLPWVGSVQVTLQKGIWGESAVEAVFGKYGQSASMCLVFLTWNTRYTPTSCVFEETWHLSCRPSHIMDLTASFSSYTSFKLDTSCKGPIRFTVAYVADICLF